MAPSSDYKISMCLFSYSPQLLKAILHSMLRVVLSYDFAFFCVVKVDKKPH